MEGSALRASRDEGLRLIKEGSFKEAAVILDRVIEADHTDAQAFLYLGVAFAELGNKAEAIASFEQSVSLKSTARGHYNLGLAYESVERLGEAMNQYEYALRLDPAHKMAQDAVARMDKMGVEAKESTAQWTIGAQSVGEQIAKKKAADEAAAATAAAMEEAAALAPKGASFDPIIMEQATLRSKIFGKLKFAKTK